MADTTTGILKRLSKQQFAVRTAKRSYRPVGSEIMVHPDIARRFVLTQGAAVTGQTERKKGRTRLVSIESVGGMPPEDFGKRPRFTDLVAIDPHERFDLGASGDESMRIVDLIAPIGKGSRQLIVSPPKAGKTVLLEHMVHAIGQCSPESRIIVLLVDERPEEVTQFRRSVECAEVVASMTGIPVKKLAQEETEKLLRMEDELRKRVVGQEEALATVSRAGFPPPAKIVAVPSQTLHVASVLLPVPVIGSFSSIV